MCSSIHIRFPCACIADIRGLATALSSKTRAAISRRSNYHRKRFGSGSPLTNTCYGAELIRGPKRVQSFAVGSQLRKCRSRLQHRCLRMHQSRVGRPKITEAGGVPRATKCCRLSRPQEKKDWRAYAELAAANLSRGLSRQQK